MAYTVSTNKALKYLEDRVLSPEWAAAHNDVAYYFKAPLAFIEAGRLEDAKKVFKFATLHVETGGLESANGVYASIYPHYPWMWMCWSATLLGSPEVAKDCFNRLSAYMDPDTGSVVVGKQPYTSGKEDQEGDFFATAEAVKVGLLTGNMELARKCARTLMKVVELNEDNMKHGRFQLRWKLVTSTSDSSGNIKLLDGDDVFHCVDQNKPGQLYFMLALPIMVMLELEKTICGEMEPGQVSAQKLLDYAKQCVGVYESPMAHKVGRAAAMVQDQETTRKVADFLVSLQKESGQFGEDPDAMDSVDQTAEIAVWLQQIDRDLNKQ